MTTPSEKYMRIQIDKRRDEITQEGCEYDGPVGDAMERAVEIYGDLRGGANHVQRHDLMPSTIWTEFDIAGEIFCNDDLSAELASVIGRLFRDPAALAMASSLIPFNAPIFQKLSDIIQSAAGLLCADLAIESIISDQEEAGRP